MDAYKETYIHVVFQYFKLNSVAHVIVGWFNSQGETRPKVGVEGSKVEAINTIDLSHLLTARLA